MLMPSLPVPPSIIRRAELDPMLESKSPIGVLEYAEGPASPEVFFLFFCYFLFKICYEGNASPP
jgi:hypothetical protein